MILGRGGRVAGVAWPAEAAMFHVEVAVALALAFGSAALGDDGSMPPQPNPSRAAVDAWLGGIPGAKAGTVAPVDAATIRSLLPGEHFYSVRFMRYPRAQLAPRPLGLENLIRVKPDGSVERIESLAALGSLLTVRLAPIFDEAHARDAVRACLRLAEEFHQDGKYTFEVAEDSVEVARQGDRLVASGKASVTRGGKGEITVALTFDGSGKVVAVEPGGQVRPDVRLR